MNQEKILVKSVFDSSACHKFAIMWYVAGFVYGWLMGWSISGLAIIGFLAGFLLSLLLGGLIHIFLYFSTKNNQITLTSYKIIGIYNKRFLLNISIDSVSSVSKGWMGSLCISCAGNNYKIPCVNNRELFCLKLNEMLNKRTQQAPSSFFLVDNQQSNYDEIERLKQLLDKGIITQEEFNTKKKQLLDL